MSRLFRSTSVLWDNAATGVATFSPKAASIGSRTTVALHVKVDGATTITVFAAVGTSGSAGRNDVPADTEFWQLYERDVSAAYSIVLGAAGSFVIDLSPFAPEYLKLKSSANVTATAYVSISG